MRPGIFVRGLDGTESRQAVITGDPISALMERLEIIIESHAPAVVAGLAVLEERLESLTLEVVTHQARLGQADDPTRRLDLGDGMQALAHPERAVRPVADGVHELVRVPHPETGHQDYGLVRLTVTVFVRELDQPIEIADQDRSVAGVVRQRLDALHHGQSFGKADRLVGLTIPVGVLEAEDVVARLHAGHGLRIGG